MGYALKRTIEHRGCEPVGGLAACSGAWKCYLPPFPNDSFINQKREFICLRRFSLVNIEICARACMVATSLLKNAATLDVVQSLQVSVPTLAYLPSPSFVPNSTLTVLFAPLPYIVFAQNALFNYMYIVLLSSISIFVLHNTV